MHSGLADYDTYSLRVFQSTHPHHDISPIEVLHMAPKKFLCVPGACGAYSSTNYVLLGFVLAYHANASSWNGYDQRAILPPGQAWNGTKFCLNGTLAAMNHTPNASVVVHGYQPNGLDVSDVSCAGGWTCGNLLATTSDVARFTYALYGQPGAIVRKETSASMKYMRYLAN